MPKRKIKKELIEGTVIEGDGFVIVRKPMALVPVNQRNKLQIIPKKRRPPKNSKTRWEFIRAFENTHGNISKSCRRANISRQTVYRWLESPTQLNQKFRERLQRTRPLEAKKDFFEECLEDIASGRSEGNATAAIFGLKSLAQDRGYRDRPEVQVNVDTGDRVTAELAKLRKQIEAMANKMDTDYKTEARYLLESEIGKTLNPAIRAELVSELEN